RPVWVVPGHPQDPHFSGSLDLLMEGALLIRDAQDLSIYFTSELQHKKTDPAGVVMSKQVPHYL
ncbi:MAG: DNA-protecting protein DprA, partial [Bdellovibrio sp.]|nr:DNA-protecting protein DprA [Bdellovibrio sp.]